MNLPIRTRLTVVYCALFCLSTAVLETGAYFSVRSGINLILDREMQARLGGVRDFLDDHIGKRPLAKVQSELASHAALQPHYLWIEDFAGQEVFGGSAKDRSSTIPLRIDRAEWKGNGFTYRLFLGTDLTLAQELLRRLRLLFLVSLPVVLAAAALAGNFISKRALRPVSRMALAARSFTAADLSQRLDVPDSADELQDLAQTLNGMLSRIEDAFRHVSQFTANASHELRTPVALIRMTSEVALLRTNGNAETYREALHRILRESEKSSVLLDDMLRLARADSEGRVLPLKPLEFNRHVEQACERMEPLARDKEIALQFEGADQALSVCAHPDHLKRLWLILLDNAIKYTARGGAILVSVRRVDSGFVACEIKDSGIGIPPADCERIFERFYRADRARSRDDGGAGLGLAIARWIADAHHARIEVESVLGKGTIFRVVLPLPAPAEELVTAMENRREPVAQ